MKLQMSKGGQYFVTLPRAVVRLKQWEKGDSIKLTIDVKGNLILSKE